MIDLGFLTDRPVAVLGLGQSGLATVRALTRSGIPVLAWDDDEAARGAARDLGVEPARPTPRDLREAALLVLSPGIPHTHPQPHPLVEAARAAGLAIVGDVELLARARADATFIGVTGTNGKSTTTALIGHILKAAGRTCEVGANIGVPALDLAPLGRGGIYVLEMSSYQLELTPSLVFDVAVLLNVSPDHLGRHGGMEGYVAAKRRIFAGQRAGATAVIGVDDPCCRSIFDELRLRSEAAVVPISGRGALATGVHVRDGTLFDARAAGGPRAVVELREARALPGEHNAQNAAAAYAAVSAVGIEPERAALAIGSFPGLAHRQELVSVIDGVAYVNDSKATNADAAARALACYDAIYWIAGGRAKEGGLAAVTPHLDRVRHAFLIGEAADAFAAELEGRVAVTRAGTLAEAVRQAKARATANGTPHPVVLLSPACASFDQFRNFEARGDAFRELVRGLGR